jgi:hypothetical protein
MTSQSYSTPRERFFADVTALLRGLADKRSSVGFLLAF